MEKMVLQSATRSCVYRLVLSNSSKPHSIIAFQPMSTATSNAKTVKGLLAVDETSMRTNKVDQTSSFLLSLVLLIGLAVFLLGLLFFMRSMTSAAKLVKLQQEPAGRGLNAEGLERDFDPPSAEEVEQLTEPAVEQTLQMVTEAISNISASLESIESSMNANNNGTGKGDSRQAGPEGEGERFVPISERWELKFTARDRRNYALQLEFFKMNIGAIGGGITTVDYVTNVASAPKKNSGASKDFKGKLYFMSTSLNVLEQYERQILQNADVPVNGRQILKFVPKETEDMLFQAEVAYYQEKRSKEVRIPDIAKTVFECRQKKKAGGYEFVVIDQRYLGPLSTKK
jgi:hypothetical protein